MRLKTQPCVKGVRARNRWMKKLESSPRHAHFGRCADLYATSSLCTHTVGYLCPHELYGLLEDVWI